MLLHLHLRLDVAASEFLEPDRDDSTRGYNPGLGCVDGGWYNAATSELLDGPWNTVKEDVGEDSSDNAVSDAGGGSC